VSVSQALLSLSCVTCVLRNKFSEHQPLPLTPALLLHQPLSPSCGSCVSWLPPRQPTGDGRSCFQAGWPLPGHGTHLQAAWLASQLGGCSSRGFRAAAVQGLPSRLLLHQICLKLSSELIRYLGRGQGNGQQGYVSHTFLGKWANEAFGQAL